MNAQPQSSQPPAWSIILFNLIFWGSIVFGGYSCVQSNHERLKIEKENRYAESLRFCEANDYKVKVVGIYHHAGYRSISSSCVVEGVKTGERKSMGTEVLPVVGDVWSIAISPAGYIYFTTRLN